MAQGHNMVLLFRQGSIQEEEEQEVEADQEEEQQTKHSDMLPNIGVRINYIQEQAQHYACQQQHAVHAICVIGRRR